MYQEARSLLTRYRMTEALLDIEPDETADSITHIVSTPGGVIKGVLIGDPFDQIAVTQDLARISSVRGEIALVAAELSHDKRKAEKIAKRIASTKFQEYKRTFELGESGGRKTVKDIEASVEIDNDYIIALDKVEDIEALREKFASLHDGLLGVENALKKALDQVRNH